MDSLSDQERSVYLQFLEIAGCEVPRSEEEEMKLIKYLSFHDWVLETCIGDFFEKNGVLDVPERAELGSSPVIPDRLAHENNLNTLQPATGNPMLNEFLTRIKYPQVLSMTDQVLSENITKLLAQRRNIDRVLPKYGYHNPSTQFVTYLGGFSRQLRNSNSFFWIMWPVFTVLDIVWRGFSYFIGLKFLFGNATKNSANDETERKVIVPLPYFKFTDQLSLLDIPVDDEKNKKTENKSTELLNLYDRNNFTDPSFELILKTCKSDLVPQLNHIELGKTEKIQYECKVKSNFLFYIILNDSFGKFTETPTVESQKSASLLNKILPSEEFIGFIKENTQVKVHIGDLAYQITPWVLFKNTQGAQITPCFIVMAKVDGLLSLLGKVNLINIKKPSQLIKKMSNFIKKFDVPLGLSLQRYELLELDYSRKLKEAQDAEFERTLKVDEAKQTKKSLINFKHLQLLSFAVNELISNKHSSSSTKPCTLQIKVLDGSRLVLKLDPEVYTVQKLYNLLEVLQYLGVTNDTSEENIRKVLTDKVEQCILDQSLSIFKPENEEEIDELDELEIENFIEQELNKCKDNLLFVGESDEFIKLDYQYTGFPSDFVVVSSFPRKEIAISQELLKDNKDLFPRANLIIETLEPEE
ncbi:hypothetical protein QEN19_001077 [Hanseniaspora menglaensis]